MNNNKKNSKFITVLVIFIIVVLCYAFVNSFFSDDKGNKNRLGKGSFNFVYNLDKDILNKLYDDKRTYKVVLDKNYGNTTGDRNKGKLYFEPKKIEYYFKNNSENPNYYKMTINSDGYLYLYKIDTFNNIISFAILGSDTKYYTASVAIKSTTDKMNLENKSWVKLDKEIELSIYPSTYYKVIDNDSCIELNLPILLDEDKFSEKIYKELKDKMEKSISIESITDYEYNYLSLGLNNKKISDNATLLLKDSRINYYQSVYDKNSKLSYTILFLMNKNKNMVGVLEIDTIDEYENYIKNLGLISKDYKYKDLDTKLYYKESSVYPEGIAYESVMFKIDNKYYMVTTYAFYEKVNDSNIDNWIDNLISGVLEIK